jgi:PAS domain S-box-containing protein
MLVLGAGVLAGLTLLGVVARDIGPWWLGTIAVAAMVLLTACSMLLQQRRAARFVSALTDAARAVADGHAPRLVPSPDAGLDDLARAIEAAGTARRAAEDRLRGGEARLAGILGSAMDAIIAVDDARRVVLFNAAAERMFGCPAAVAVGEAIDRFVSLDVQRLLRHEFRLRPTGEDLVLPPATLLAFRADGTEFPVEAAISHVQAGSERLSTLIVRDVTERRRAEDERAELLRREQAARAAAESQALRASFLAEASRLVASSLESEGLAALARLAAGTLGDWCVVDLVNADATMSRVAVAHADPARHEMARVLQQRYPPGPDGPATIREVLDTGRPVVTVLEPDEVEHRARSAEHLRLLRGLGVRAVMAVPLVARDRIMGVITLVRADGDAYSEDELRIVEELADRAAMAVDRAQLYGHVQEARERFGRLVEGLDAIVWEADPLTLAFTFVTRRAEDILGYPVERWLDEPEFWRSIVHADDRETCTQRFARCARDGVDSRFEYRVTAADGRIVWVENVLHAARDTDARTARLHGFMLDVTERKRLEEEHHRLLASEQAARAAAEAAARRAKLVAEASQVLASSLDYEATLKAVTRLAVPTFADWCLVHLTDDDKTPRLHVAHAQPGGAPVAEALERLALGPDLAALSPAIGMLQDGAPLLLADISPVWLETLRLVQELQPRSVMIVPLVARGRPIGTLTFVWTQPEKRYDAADLALAEDLARRAAVAVDNARLYREAEQANRTKDEFLATLSHELRTPLTAMLGWVLSLRSGRLGREQTERALESIERNTRHQAQLINDLLDVSRIAAGKLELDRQPVDLGTVVEAAVESIRPTADGRGVTVTWRQSDSEVPVLGDPVRLQQVVLNLLANAVKFTPHGGNVDVALARDGATARITVADTGQGIEAEMLPHVFETFRQADGSSTRRHGGLGLGLAIVRHLVELHGGTVEAQSAGRDAGSTFTATLPLLAVRVPPAASGGSAPMPRHDAGLARLDGIRVLAVDDHADARDLVETILDERGAKVLVAASATEALRILQTTYVDVLVTDIGMPGQSGYELIERVREIERAHGGRIPAVALTAYAGREDLERALAAGFEAHAAKPVTPAELIDVVARAARRQPLR